MTCVTWYTLREPPSDVENERLRHAFRKHLKADFAVSREGSAFGDGAILITGDERNRLSVAGCLSLIRDTLER